MATRESINRVKIERFRVGRMPVNGAETIYQGDLLCWDAANKRATKASSASGALFVGMSDTKNPIETAGSTTFLTDAQLPRVNVIQQGLVEVCWGTNEMVYPFDEVVINSDAQTCIKGSSNPIGIIDPGYTAAGFLATSSGVPIRIWLRVPNAYRCQF